MFISDKNKNFERKILPDSFIQTAALERQRTTKGEQPLVKFTTKHVWPLCRVILSTLSVFKLHAF